MFPNSFCMPLPVPERARLWDAATIKDFGLPGEVLMESAARNALAVLKKNFNNLRDKRIWFFVGTGNNGGDATAMARMLKGQVADIQLIFAKPKERPPQDAGLQLDLAEKVGLSAVSADSLASAEPPDIIVDGLLGTGFAGNLRDPFDNLVKMINKIGRHAYVLSLDIPSGLDAVTGKPCPEAVRANATVSFDSAKPGLVLPEAKEFVGRLKVREINIPDFVKEKYPADIFLLSPNIRDLMPPLDPCLHKGKAGRVLIVAGSRGLAGAANLCALGALRAGGGLVTVACPGAIETNVRGGYPDIMTLPIGKSDTWEAGMAESIEHELGRFDSLVLGPGLGRHPGTGAFVREVLSFNIPMLVDADALFWLAQEKNLAGRLGDNHIITPHPGEMLRLLGEDCPEVKKGRFAQVRELASRFECVAILKGAATLIVSNKPEEITLVNPHISPCLAVGGSGDILAGIVGTLVSRHIPALHAAALGVYWHGLCGRLLAKEYPHRGNLPSEIAHHLPTTLNQWLCAPLLGRDYDLDATGLFLDEK